MIEEATAAMLGSNVSQIPWYAYTALAGNVLIIKVDVSRIV